ncbi:hypothetical protein H8D64_01820 [PVC group bacterium]|nr:hypothetical protein [PVC group bacterium]
MGEQKSEVLSRQQFQQIASRLDVGGDLFFVGNLDGLIEQFVDDLLSGLSAVPAKTPGDQTIKESMGRLQSFLGKNGFFAFRGVGASIKPRSDGDHSVKIFIQRDNIDSGLPLWRGLVGWHPRRLICLDFLPPDTAFAYAATLEMESIWNLLNSAVKEVVPKKTAETFAMNITKTQNFMGMGVGQILSSLANELFVSVQLSSKEKIILPTSVGFVTIPEPSFLACTAVEDETLRALIEIQISKRGKTVVEKQVGAYVMRYVERPLFPLLKIQPAYASCSGFFIMGSSPEVVEKALLSYAHKSGLVARREFKNAFRGLTMINNGIIYAAPAMGKAIAKIKTNYLESIRTTIPQHPATEKIISRLIHHSANASCAYVVQNWKSGIMIAGNSSRSGKDLIADLTAAPLGLLTALLMQEKDGVTPYKSPVLQKTNQDHTNPED